MILNGQYNIGSICTRLQCARGLGERTAMRWVGADRRLSRGWTFADLEAETNRFANALRALGFARGDVFFTFLPKLPEQFIAFLGALKLQLITGTLFANFGEDALLDRLGDAGAKGVITKKSFLKKFVRIRDRLPALRTIILVDADDHLAPDILSLKVLMAGASADFSAPATGPDAPSVLHYTSGSTGKSKGVLHRHGSVLSQSATARDVLGLRGGDVFWCTADQGWVTGTSYGIIGPWSLGVTQVHFGGAYDAAAWFDILEGQKVNVWYSAPTALRMLMREDDALFAEYDLSALRSIFSVGEPLNPEVIRWARGTLGKDVHDTWFQTETGAIMITNRPGLEIRPGSMGKPVAGISAAILDGDGKPVSDGTVGNLCFRPGWPGMFTAYLNHEDVYRQRFRGGFYHSGDTAYRDADGYFWFQGRSDDIINTAGHLVSPFEVESALLEVGEVAEAGVIGAPDDLLFEKVVAFVALRGGQAWSPELELKLRIYVSNKVSTVATPQEIVPVEAIPKNKSGKIMRRVLKARYLGGDCGDLSTLDQD
ncbi:MAG: AMP-binding protein [Elusimicrobia bacterium]|nr:AMP-binding protein [Elusimicrobiota bacterium]